MRLRDFEIPSNPMAANTTMRQHRRPIPLRTKPTGESYDGAYLAFPCRSGILATVLVVMAGLPGTGKSVVAYGLGARFQAPVLSVDPVEAAMLRAGVDPAEPIGLAAYVVVEAIALDLIELGQSVIVDAVNSVEPARRMWRRLAASTGQPMRVLEVVCSDPDVHRARLAERDRGERAAREPTWDEIEQRRQEYHPWHEPTLVLDSVYPLDQLLDRAAAYLLATP